MMKISVLILLTACSVYCNLTFTSTQKEIARSVFDVTNHIKSQTKQNTLDGNSYSKILLEKPVDCADVLQMGHNRSGIYQIWPISTPTHRTMEEKSFFVYCDMDTNGDGWTVIQRRGDFKRPIDYFHRNWENYKKGFGKIEEDFWFGNDNICELTNQKIYSVRFDLRDVEGNKRYAVYDEFWIDDEKRKYMLHINQYSGDAGDSMTYHNNKNFSTFDQVNAHGCGGIRKNGWWKYGCGHSNLNGFYHKGNYKSNEGTVDDGIFWYYWKNSYHYSLEWTEIKIRPKYFRATFL